jgi:hypothetical protein
MAMGGKELLLLADNIDSIGRAILEGTEKEKESFAKRHYFISDTPELLKKYGVTGDYITVRYGVISRHFGKDPAHNLTAEHWKKLIEEIVRPFAISEYKKGFRLFTNVKIGEKWGAAGIDVKKTGKTREVNNVATAFGYNFHKDRKEKIIYISEKASPEQAAVLNRLNSGQYLPARGEGGVSAGSKPADA